MKTRIVLLSVLLMTAALSISSHAQPGQRDYKWVLGPVNLAADNLEPERVRINLLNLRRGDTVVTVRALQRDANPACADNCETELILLDSQAGIVDVNDVFNLDGAAQPVWFEIASGATKATDAVVPILEIEDADGDVERSFGTPVKSWAEFPVEPPPPPPDKQERNDKWVLGPVNLAAANLVPGRVRINLLNLRTRDTVVTIAALQQDANPACDSPEGCEAELVLLDGQADAVDVNDVLDLSSAVQPVWFEIRSSVTMVTKAVVPILEVGDADGDVGRTFATPIPLPATR